MARLALHVAGIGALAASLLAGCTKVQRDDATTQFLLSIASSQATDRVSAAALRGRTVFIDDSNMVVPDLSNPAMRYMVGEFRAQLLLAGARMVENRGDAQIIVEVRTGGIGIDAYEFLLGLPSLPLGAVAGAAGAPPVQITSPELALIKNRKQLGYASVAYVAYWADTGEVVAASGPHVGRSYREDWWFFGAGPRSIGNVPTVRMELE